MKTFCEGTIRFCWTVIYVGFFAIALSERPSLSQEIPANASDASVAILKCMNLIRPVLRLGRVLHPIEPRNTLNTRLYWHQNEFDNGVLLRRHISMSGIEVLLDGDQYSKQWEVVLFFNNVVLRYALTPLQVVKIRAGNLGLEIPKDFLRSDRNIIVPVIPKQNSQKEKQNVATYRLMKRPNPLGIVEMVLPTKSTNADSNDVALLSRQLFSDFKNWVRLESNTNTTQAKLRLGSAIPIMELEQAEPTLRSIMNALISYSAEERTYHQNHIEDLKSRGLPIKPPAVPFDSLETYLKVRGGFITDSPEVRKRIMTAQEILFLAAELKLTNLDFAGYSEIVKPVNEGELYQRISKCSSELSKGLENSHPLLKAVSILEGHLSNLWRATFK